MADKPQLISCSDECGHSLPAETIESSGWTYLQIRGRWRCPECRRALEQVNQTDLTAPSQCPPPIP